MQTALAPDITKALKPDPMSLYGTEAYRHVHDLSKLQPYPTLIVVMASSLCNLHCRMCPRESKVPRREITGLGNGQMSVDIMRKVIEESAEYKNFIGYIFALYGEPLMNPKMVDIVRLVKASGKNVQITTNGTFLNEKKIRALLAAGIDKIKISFQGASKREYELWRRKGDYDLVVANIHRLLEIREEMAANTFIQIGTSFCGDTDDEIASFLGYWHGKVDHIYYDYTGLSHIHFEDPAMKDYQVRFRAPIRQEKCFDIFTRMNILYNGQAAFCVDDEEEPIGDVTKQSIAEIWLSEARMQHRRTILEKGNVFLNCKNCYTAPRAPLPAANIDV